MNDYTTKNTIPLKAERYMDLAELAQAKNRSMDDEALSLMDAGLATGILVENGINKLTKAPLPLLSDLSVQDSDVYRMGYHVRVPQIFYLKLSGIAEAWNVPIECLADMLLSFMIALDCVCLDGLEAEEPPDPERDSDEDAADAESVKGSDDMEAWSPYYLFQVEPMGKGGIFTAMNFPWIYFAEDIQAGIDEAAGELHLMRFMTPYPPKPTALDDLPVEEGKYYVGITVCENGGHFVQIYDQNQSILRRGTK